MEWILFALIVFAANFIKGSVAAKNYPKAKAFTIGFTSMMALVIMVLLAASQAQSMLPNGFNIDLTGYLVFLGISIIVGVWCAFPHLK
jgi:hypothetical protein